MTIIIIFSSKLVCKLHTNMYEIMYVEGHEKENFTGG